jgi:hypothetical protein
MVVLINFKILKSKKLKRELKLMMSISFKMKKTDKLKSLKFLENLVQHSRNYTNLTIQSRKIGKEMMVILYFSHDSEFKGSQRN